tara:strand:+ start:1056 stop:1847 length:792 start_codon:yes stop_codon:yes gene_type:complete
MVNLYAWDLRRKILAEPRYIEEKRLLRFGFKGYSQNEEDGIIQEIFRRIGTANKTFVEIGVSSGLECNTLYLLLQGWRGLWIEGCSDFVDLINQKFAFALNNETLKVKHAWVQRDNINQLIAERREGSEDLDLLSLDIDGNDYHVLEATDLLNARVVIVEYNPKYQPPVKWVMEYNPNHSYDGSSDYLGASLKSFEILLSAKGYKLVGCNLLGVNAFFVRADLVKNHFPDDYSAENHYEPERFFLKDGLIPLHAANFGPFQIK